MTTPIPIEQRKRRGWRRLSGDPGTIWHLVPEFAAERKYLPRTIGNVRYAICDLKDAIGREPMPADLTVENLDRVKLQLEVTVAKSGVANTLIILKALWEWCATRGLVPEAPLAYRPRGGPGNWKGHVWNSGPDGEVVKLSEDEGTLWGICLREYFPKNPQISSPETRDRYAYALRVFKTMLGHDPTPADLSDDNCVAMLKVLKEKGRAPEGLNSTVGRIRALWNWLAKRRIVEQFPTYRELKEPKRIPKAWTKEEVIRLFEASRKAKGMIVGVRWCDWITAFQLIIWDTAERMGAVLRTRKEWINWETGDIVIPAEARKGQDADLPGRLKPETLEVLKRILKADSDLVFGVVHPGTVLSRYRKLRRDAGLPTDRKSAPSQAEANSRDIHGRWWP